MGATAPGRPATVTLTTPWYPVPYNRMAGAYVADHARLVSRLADRVEVVHGLEWPGGAPDVVAGLRAPFDALLDRACEQGTLRLTGACGPVTRVPVMITAGMTVAQRAEALVADVRRGLGGRLPGELVHGHVAYLGGLVAARLAEPGVPVFATEHSTGLRELLADPQGRAQYQEVLERATRVLCVSGLLRDQVLEALPGYEDKLAVLPNPVDFSVIPARETPLQALDRWVFVGGLIERKGVERLVRAFCSVAADNPRAELTLYGDGPLRGRLEELATEAGVRDRLHLRGVVRHSELLKELRTHELLVAPSVYETFHLAVPEAVAAGLAVVVTRSGGPEEALAGVEDLVGRFVDVEESPDQLVAAYHDLLAGLGALDLPKARAVLEDRYGVDAVARRLAEEYGVPAPTVPVAPPGDGGPARDEVYLLAASAWRRYAVSADLQALTVAERPATVVTTDAELTGLAQQLGQPVLAPPQLAALPPVVRRQGVRPALGRLRRRLADRPATVGLDAERTELVVTDCHSAPLAAQLVARQPGLRVSFEVDRSGALGPPADAREGAA